MEKFYTISSTGKQSSIVYVKDISYSTNKLGNLDKTHWRDIPSFEIAGKSTNELLPSIIFSNNNQTWYSRYQWAANHQPQQKIVDKEVAAQFLIKKDLAETLLNIGLTGFTLRSAEIGKMHSKSLSQHEKQEYVLLGLNHSTEIKTKHLWQKNNGQYEHLETYPVDKYPPVNRSVRKFFIDKKTTIASFKDTNLTDIFYLLNSDGSYGQIIYSEKFVASLQELGNYGCFFDSVDTPCPTDNKDFINEVLTTETSQKNTQNAASEDTAFESFTPPVQLKQFCAKYSENLNCIYQIPCRNNNWAQTHFNIEGIIAPRDKNYDQWEYAPKLLEIADSNDGACYLIDPHQENPEVIYYQPSDSLTLQTGVKLDEFLKEARKSIK